MKYEHRICYDIEKMIKSPLYNLDDIAQKMMVGLAYGQLNQDEYSYLMSLLDEERLARKEKEQQK